MTAVIDAVYRNGVFCPATPPDLPEGTAVRLTVVPNAPTSPPLTEAERIALIGEIIAKYNPATDNPEVTSANVDQVLYGGPKGAR